MSGSGDDSSSPVCYANEADPGYMGCATSEEILAFLRETLLAEEQAAHRLREMLPKIRDDALHAELKGMLASHEQIIAAIAARISRS